MARANRLLLIVVALMPAILSAQSSALDSIINPASGKQIVETLAADSFLGRMTGTPQCEQAAKYIANEFSKAGCAPGAGNNSYLVPFSALTGGESGFLAHNVIGILPGKSKFGEWVLFSAHYDHIGTKSTNFMNFLPENGRPEKNDTIWNGANDNASGVAALILLARYFAQVDNNERTLAFIAFAGEELGLLGSKYMARNIVRDSTFIAMINMDMLGVPFSRKNRNPIITGSGLSNLQIILNNTLYEKFPQEFGRNFFRYDPFQGDRLFSRSDNYHFAVKGIPAHTVIATSPHNQYYHSLNDEPSTLDYELLAKITKAIALGSGGLAAGTQTPTRINPARIKD